MLILLESSLSVHPSNGIETSLITVLAVDLAAFAFALRLLSSLSRNVLPLRNFCRANRSIVILFISAILKSTGILLPLSSYSGLDTTSVREGAGMADAGGLWS